jgi:hypothetical protein
MKMDPEKIPTIQDWEQPSNLKEIHAFLRFANFYRPLVHNYSSIVQCLTSLTRKGIPFAWMEEQQMAFHRLKYTFTSAPILTCFELDPDIIVEMDAPDYIWTSMLSEYDDNNVLHPVAYLSMKHSPVQCNYEIYNNELMAIVQAFEELHPELQCIIHPICVLSDHKNLEYFVMTKFLNRRQAHRSQFLC